MYEDNDEDDCCPDDFMPRFGVFEHSNHDEQPKIMAIFRELKHADTYLNAYKVLDESQFMTIQVPCRDEEGVFHIICTMTARGMEVVEEDDGVLKAVPKELAPAFGDKWVSRKGGN